MHIDVLTMTFRIVVALVCGGLLGYEREWRQRAAGLRTHTLVAVGACIIMIASAYGLADVLPFDHVEFDPSRIAAQVVSGIGFLGAGVIIFRKSRVSGLTTAASVWVSAGVGIAAGGGLLVLAGIGTVAVLVVQTVVRSFELRHFGRFEQLSIALRAKHGTARLSDLESIFAKGGNVITRLQIDAHPGETDRFLIFLTKAPDLDKDSLVKRLTELKGVLSVRCRVQ